MATIPNTDPVKFLADVFAIGQEQMRQFTANASAPAAVGDGAKPMDDAASHWMAASQHLLALQQSYLQQATQFWTSALSFPAALPGLVPGPTTPAATTSTSTSTTPTATGLSPAVTDRRFAGEAWSKDPRFDLVRQTYGAYSNFMQQAVDLVPVDERSKNQLRFAARQFTDAMSPANFFLTNPEAINLAVETGGQSVAEGMKLFFEDFGKGRVTMTDETVFEVGRDLAVTPGSVVYENELMQLIQYSPTTPEVYARPLLIVPPCINKFYILDLQPENSFVRYAVEQGHTVFMISWRNVSEEQGKLTWDDYIAEGLIRAVDVVLDVTRSKTINALGFCIGGALLACALAVMKAKGDERIESLTLLTTMLDYSDTGELGLLITDESVALREATIGQNGVLHGKELASMFAALRANDLIWPYVVNSYLKGKAPPSFDLLFWNSDASNLPGPMFCWYIRNTYLENKLRIPGATVQAGVPVDLTSIDVPAFVYASREDHIVPWMTAYKSLEILSGEKTFVLGASGHIAGVINPPAKKKRNYWTDGADGEKADHWLETAREVPGSWWPHWMEWLSRFAGKRVPARAALGNKQHPPIESAPGRYVKAHAE